MIGTILRVAGRIASYLLYLLTLVSAFGGYVPPKIWALPSVLTLAFPYLLIATLLTGVAWLLGKRIFTAIAAGVVVIVCWPVAKDACPVGFASKSDGPSFSLMTYNVYQLRDPAPTQQTLLEATPTLDYILKQRADIVCLQELGNLPRKGERGVQADSLKQMYPYIIKGKPHQGDYTTFMLLSKYPAKEVPLPDWMWIDACLYRVVLPGNYPIHIFNVHLTSYQLTYKQRKVVSRIRGIRSAKESLKMEKKIYGKLSEAFRQRQHLAGILRSVMDTVPGPLIVCGDFNDVPASYAYRIMRGDDMKDAVAQTTFGPVITYNAHRFWFHIDQVLYRGDRLKALSTKKGTLKSSDHYPLTVTFAY